MYALVEDNEVKQIITNPKAMVIGDVRYPTKIFQMWSQSELNAIGIYEVITDLTNKKDETYYINTNEEYNFSDNQVTRLWGTATPKRLEDEDAVDEDGENVLDDDGNQVINYGLKTEKKKIIKQQASGLLAPTDWYVVKSTEVADYDVPANILSFRADVRAKSNEMETQIDACTTVEELETLYTYTITDGVQSRPLAEFPKEI
nr:N-acetylmuramidase/lysin [uncultured Mediterranean phage uvMED]